MSSSDAIASVVSTVVVGGIALKGMDLLSKSYKKKKKKKMKSMYGLQF